MALGMDMMLRSFGLDPEQINKAIANVGQIAIEANDRLKAIQATQTEILKLLQNQKGASHDGQPGNADPARIEHGGTSDGA